MAKNKNEATVEDLKAPLLAAVGAADLALATVNEILVSLRDRAGTAGDRMDDRRAVLTRLQDELPKRTEELRGKLTSEELRKAAEEFFVDATEAYNNLVVRGEATLERLMGQPEFRDAAGRVEGYVDQAVELTQEALGVRPPRSSPTPSNAGTPRRPAGASNCTSAGICNSSGSTAPWWVRWPAW